MELWTLMNVLFIFFMLSHSIVVRAALLQSIGLSVFALLVAFHF